MKNTGIGAQGIAPLQRFVLLLSVACCLLPVPYPRTF
jgi:hypothetical protein